MSDTRIISKVNALLALAMDENASEHERQLAQERADAMMAQHMIDRMDLKVEDKSRVESTRWEIDLYQAGAEFSQNVSTLMYTIINHTNCRSAYQNGGYTIVGYPEDMAYAERLWFKAFREFVMQINPKWDNEKSLGENTYNFKRAGYTWNQVWRKAFAAGQHPVDPYVPGANEGKRLGKAYREEVKRRGEEVKRNTQRHGAYRASYAQAFTGTLRNRLRAMRKKSEEAVSDRDKFALALRDTSAEVEAEFYLMFPQYDPEVQRREAQRRERERAEAFALLSPEEQAAQRAAEEKQRKRDEAAARRYFEEQRSGRNRVDDAGWERGREAAERVDLSNNKDFARAKVGIEG